MKCRRKSILTTIFIVTLMVTLVVVFFVSGFPLQNKHKQASLDSDDNSESSIALRGTISPSAEDSLGFQDGVVFVPDKENVGATLNPSDVATEPRYYDDYSWDELPLEVLNAATTLGFTEESWDNSEAFALANVEWSELSQEQQDAASIIGYNERKWNNKEKAEEEYLRGTLDPTADGTVFAFHYARFQWADLPPDIQNAAEYIGFSEDMWNSSQYLPLKATKWKNLTDAQRTAAATIGYDEDIWNDGSV